MMRHPAWWLVAALLAGAAWALDPPRPAPAPTPDPESPAAAEQSPATGQPVADEAEAPQDEPAEEEVPPPAAESRSTGPTPQRFDPSEKVRADFPVSFPIDI